MNYFRCLQYIFPLRLAIKLRCEKLKELCVKKLDTPLFCNLMDSGHLWKLEPELVEALLEDDNLCIQEWDVSRICGVVKFLTPSQGFR